MPLRSRLTMNRTVAWRWLVPRNSPASAASASTASGRTLDGPHPKRPSDGSRSAGMRMSGLISEWAPSTICHYRDRSSKERNPLPRISERVAAIAESATLAVDAKAKALKAAGEPFIGFGAGDPDFPPPEHIVEAAAEACRDPRNPRYTPAG